MPNSISAGLTLGAGLAAGNAVAGIAISKSSFESEAASQFSTDFPTYDSDKDGLPSAAKTEALRVYNAYVHAWVSARFAEEYGADFSRFLGHGREFTTQELQKLQNEWDQNEQNEQYKDLNNNDYGIQNLSGLTNSQKAANLAGQISDWKNNLGSELVIDPADAQAPDSLDIDLSIDDVLSAKDYDFNFEDVDFGEIDPDDAGLNWRDFVPDWIESAMDWTGFGGSGSGSPRGSGGEGAGSGSGLPGGAGGGSGDGSGGGGGDGGGGGGDDDNGGGNGGGGRGTGGDFFGDIWGFISPLAFDLDGDGIELTALDENTVAMFDIDSDGFAERVGWVGADDGLLTIDLNSDGIVNNNTELFGSATTHGFAYLDTYDTVRDGVINSSDAQWSELKVWKDANQDGVSHSGELYSFASLGITAISLANVIEVDDEVAGNYISHESTYTIGGVNREIVDVWFAVDQMNSIYKEEFTINLQTMFLPTQRGYGTLKDLHVEASQNDDLLSMIKVLDDTDYLSFFTDHLNSDAAIQEIVFEWAQVSNIDPDSRGGRIDARKLEFLEKFSDERFLQGGYQPDPFKRAANALEDVWTFVYQQIKSNLLMQAGAFNLFADQQTYNFQKDGFDSTSYALNSDAIDALELEIGQLSSPAQVDAWVSVAEFIKYTVGFDDLTDNLDAGDQALLDQAIAASTGDVLKDWDYIKNLTNVTNFGNTIIGTSSADLIDATFIVPTTSGDDTVNGFDGNDTIDGGAGDDHINGGNGADILIGGLGGDLLTGGAGDDDFYVEGDDVLNESNTGFDEVFLKTGIIVSDISFYRADDYDLYIVVDGDGVIQLDNHFHTTAEAFERINFSDSTYYDLSTLTALITYGSNANDASLTGLASLNDTIYGFDGNDVIQGNAGNDLLDGGNGNDIVRGGDGDDIYVASKGYDEFRDSNSSSGGFDTIQFGAGIALNNLSIYKFGLTDLMIEWGETGDLIKISQFFVTSSNYKIEQLRFADNSTYSLTSGTIAVHGDHSNNSLSGLGISGFSDDDIIYGWGGADTLSGGNGNDILYGGEGNDTLQGQNNNDVLYGEAGNDALIGNAGNDVLYGGSGDDNLKGYSGDDIFIYDGGMDVIGQDSVSDRGGTDTLKFEAGISLYSLTFQDASTDANDARIILSTGVNEVLVDQQNGSNANYKAEKLLFDGGLELTFTDYDFWIWGTSGNNTLYGDVSGTYADTILANAGNDTVHGLNGNDEIDGSDGNDLIYGDAGNDLLYGGGGGDNLFGGSGLDTLVGGAGADTYNFEAASAYSNIDILKGFTTADGDVLDLSDLLTSYNPITDLITSFVQLTDSSGNTVVSVDKDGAGSSFTMQQIATITGVTGLTDEVAMVTNGNLVVV